MLDLKESQFLYETYFISNSLSLFGQLFILVTYISIRNKSNRFYDYVAWHSILELPWLISNYITVNLAESDTDSCELIAFLNVSSYVSSMIWSSVIAWVILDSLKKRQRIPKVKLRGPLIVFIFSVCLGLYSYFRREFGPFKGTAIQYCWYKNSSSTLTYWIPFVITTLLNIYWYARTIYIVHKSASREASKAFWGLFAFPLIQIVCNSGGIISKVLIGLNFEVPEWLELAHFITAKSQGLFEAFAYALNRGVWSDISKVWCCKKKKKDNLKKPLKMFNEESFNSETSQSHLIL